MEEIGASMVPEVCLLPTTDRPLRVAEFDELARTAVVGHERLSATRLRLSLTSIPEIAAATAELAARETQCCDFFRFTLEVTSRELALLVEVPPTQVAVLDGLDQLVSGVR